MILPTKFGDHRVFQSNLTLGWPLMTPDDLWPQQCTTLWPGVLFTKFGNHRAFLRQIDLWMTFDPRWGRFKNMPTTDKQIDPYLTPSWPLHDLQLQKCIMLWSGVLPTKFGGHRALLSKLTVLDPNWPLHDHRPQQCITLWSGILPTTFGGYRAFPRHLTPSWPQMTPAWPLTPAMHYILFRGGSHQIW